MIGDGFGGAKGATGRTTAKNGEAENRTIETLGEHSPLQGGVNHHEPEACGDQPPGHSGRR
tara:strand:- start:400 stop:582 length:183 start_codon:yes stop_codon:yes gene_type:complete